MKVTVLGCGASLGVPAAGGFWGRCDPKEKRNERTRAAIFVEEGDTRILVDATYDLRTQLNRHNIRDVDALLLSHAHSDHISGIDDLRAIAFNHEKKIDLYTDQPTMDELKHRMGYIFNEDHEVYTNFVEPKIIGEFDTFDVGGVEVKSFAQDHKVCTSLGFRFGDIAYSVDMVDLTDEALEALKGVETWIVDGGGYQRADASLTTHANIARVMRWIDVIKPKMTYLTVMSGHMDYRTLCEELPPHVRPAWDGLEIESGTNRR